MAAINQFDVELFVQILPDLAFGAMVTLKLTVLSIIFGLIIGTVAGLGRVSKNFLPFAISTAYVEVIRGTPLLVQILIVYFGLPAIGINLQPEPAGIIALSVCSGAYIAEIVRAGIESIPIGQMEAARSLGMTYLQAMRYVIFPQAFRNILPALGNEFIALLKDSSLLSVISIVELTRVGRQIVNTTFNAWTPFLGVALFYLMMTIPLSRLVSYSQRKLGVYEVK
ncbi:MULTISPECIES: amino acid ABC transporter permease [unclassified Archaeoglobus]|jgi:polar amino acid transport system permease protein|uniref:amino acid ABC transporter permease n=1 Tax=unclassified Archaeoglobus TaxID=2643606 RepID=UPI0025BC2CEB|nr:MULTISPECIES: amino acid ABC transporter permease [unclassified Archaeoglobus]